MNGKLGWVCLLHVIDMFSVRCTVCDHFKYWIILHCLTSTTITTFSVKALLETPVSFWCPVKYGNNVGLLSDWFNIDNKKEYEFINSKHNYYTITPWKILKLESYTKRDSVLVSIQMNNDSLHNYFSQS